MIEVEKMNITDELDLLKERVRKCCGDQEDITNTFLLEISTDLKRLLQNTKNDKSGGK